MLKSVFKSFWITQQLKNWIDFYIATKRVIAMKHSLKITLVLIMLFLLSQIIGLATINKYIIVEKSPDGATIIRHQNTVLGEQPELNEEEKKLSAIFILIAVLIGTGLIFLLIKFKLGRFWKIWYLISVGITMTIAFNVYIPATIAVILAIILAALKTFRYNPYLHNLTEIFIYTGITIIILPFISLYSGFLLLILISIYDMIAVWKSKHMIKLAQFQTDSKVFAGLMLNYPKKDTKSKVTSQNVVSLKNEGKGSGTRTAILGGGDIAFPLMFNSAVMEYLIVVGHLTKSLAFMQSTIIALFTTIALAILLIKSEKGKFYPAMPFISIGCIVGYIVIWAIRFI